METFKGGRETVPFSVLQILGLNNRSRCTGDFLGTLHSSASAGSGIKFLILGQFKRCLWIHLELNDRYP
jgi:hypothetical protein